LGSSGLLVGLPKSPSDLFSSLGASDLAGTRAGLNGLAAEEIEVAGPAG
jgi:hypothetical protein